MGETGVAASPRRRWLPGDPVVGRLALATLVAASGRGIFFTISALYFTRIVGLSVIEVGTGLSIAAAVGLFAGVPLGHLADRVGPREVHVCLSALLALCLTAYLTVDEWWQFVTVAAAVSSLMSGNNAVRNAMIAGLTRGAARASTKAYLRAVTNLGMSLGTGVAALVLLVDTRVAYQAGMAVNAAAAACAAVIVWSLPHVPPTAAEQRRSMLYAARDVRFLAVVLASSVLTMHFWILEIALPLWVVGHTEAPRWLVSVLIGINTGAVILAQVRVARRVITIRQAGRATTLAGVAILVGCLLMGLTAGLDRWPAAVLLVVALLVLTVGELLQSAGGFVYSFELPPEEAMGQYQGLWGLNFGIASFVAPTVMALLPLALGLTGWLLLGGLLLGAAVTTRWAGTRAAPPRPDRNQMGVSLP